VVPNDALVYLESGDLGATLGAITGSAKFRELAATTPDLSPLNGVNLSIAVTGFETSEQAVTEENSVLNFRPRFVAVAETNAWGWQTKSFVENQLGEFVNEVYGGAVELEVTTRNDGEYYVWTSPEGRKAYALQQGSLVFFGNDESAIERCQAVKRGEAESIVNNSRITDDERLALGYISPEGVGQIANIAGISVAMRAGDEDEIKSFVSRVFPEILRNTIRDVLWTTTKNGEVIEDKLIVALDNESSRVFNATLEPAKGSSSDLESFVPAGASGATRYLLRDPQIAWRSILLTTTKKTDETSGSLIAAFSGSVFEPYGIEEPEVFLSSVGTPIVTVRLGPESDDVAVIARVKERSAVRKSIAKEIDLSAAPEKHFEADVWRSADGELAAGLAGDTIVIGNAGVVLKCLEASRSDARFEMVQEFSASDAVAVTVAGDETQAKLIEAFATRKNESDRVVLFYKTETRFNVNGIERRTTSDFGLIGSIVEWLLPE
jgi:hypothetical protein